MRNLRFAASFILIAVLAVSLVKAESGPYVRVIKSRGKAELLRSGETAWKSVKKGARLYSGDSLKTSRNSSVEIGFDRGKKNIANIRPGSHVVLKLEASEKIKLIDGEVFLLVRGLPRGSGFEVRTPTAVCGARGTGWGARGDKNKTVTSAYEEKIYVRGIKKDGRVAEDEVIVPEGHESVISRFGRPSRPSRISEKNYGKWDKWRGNVARRVSREKTKMERLTGDLDKIESKKERIEDRIDEDRLRKRSDDTGAGGGTTGGDLFDTREQ
jgi:hypothetical protein